MGEVRSRCATASWSRRQPPDRETGEARSYRSRANRSRARLVWTVALLLPATMAATAAAAQDEPPRSRRRRPRPPPPRIAARPEPPRRTSRSLTPRRPRSRRGSDRAGREAEDGTRRPAD